MKIFILIAFFLTSFRIGSQIYTVNSTNDIDDGICDGVHCSFREALNASDKDGTPSVIRFNIPGVAPYTIVPQSPFPTVNESDLNIEGETQSGGSGSIIIDFQLHNYNEIPFWVINGSRFSISGIDFKGFLFAQKKDRMIQFGNFNNNIVQDCSIRNCSFISDSSLTSNDEMGLIHIIYANNTRITNCNFGTDKNRLRIFKLVKAISVIADDPFDPFTVTIDSNLFVNSNKAITWWGGRLKVENNLFGVLDTINNLTSANSDYAIWGRLFNSDGEIQKNYFNGYKNAAIYITSFEGSKIKITANQFINNITDINIDEDYNGVYTILRNDAKNGSTFLTANRIIELYVENNNLYNYDNAINYFSETGIQKCCMRIIRHINNKFNCINKNLVVLNPHSKPWHSVPVLLTVNRNQITGTGNPSDSVIIYSNDRKNCPDAICEGGNELGRTQADGLGNWVLNVVYPNKSSISAFQFDSDPNLRPTMYSEFSSCYQCPGIVHINYNQSICQGESVNYRGRSFSYLKPVDSFLIKGDDVSICDSMFLINLSVYPKLRSQLDIKICSDDTLIFGSVKIYPEHLLDSIILQSTYGCDSNVVINAVLTGFGQLNRIICTDGFLKIGSSIFNKDHLSGRAVIQKGSITGCDSIVDVKLNIDYTKSIELPNDTTIHKGSQLAINTNINFIASSIIWSPNFYLSCDTCLNPLSKPDDNITYHLTAIDENGCTVTDHFTITILFDKADIFIPTAFSPNGDNINDFFEPVFKFSNSTKITVFKIFDRWGNQIYERLNGAIGESFGWDGTVNGEKVNPGVYIYSIQFVGDDKVLKWKTGDITLMR